MTSFELYAAQVFAMKRLTFQTVNCELSEMTAKLMWITL
jgi:hypothetical protein